MFSTKLIVKKLSDSETVGSSDKPLQLRWLSGVANDKQMAFKLWNDLTNNPNLIVDKEIEVEFKIESREHNGRFFTDLTITKIL